VSPPQPFSVPLTTSAAVLELTPIPASEHGCWLATLPSMTGAVEWSMNSTLAAEIAHDLRMPLQAVLGWVSLLRQWPPDPKRLDDALTVIERNTRLQGELLNDLLDMTCPEGVVPVREPSRADFADVVRSTIESLMPLAKECGIHVAVTAGATPVAVSVRAQDLSRIAANLIANAIKFSRSGGSVECDVSEEEGWGRLIVRDEGRGISAGFLPRMFAAFLPGTPDSRCITRARPRPRLRSPPRPDSWWHGAGGERRAVAWCNVYREIPLETAHAELCSESLRGAIR
jgi:hypothetical protein